MKTKQKTLITLLLALGSMTWAFSYAALNTWGWDQRTLQVNEIAPVSCDNQKKLYLDEDNDNDTRADKSFFMNNNLMITTAPTQPYNAVHIYRDNTNNSTRVLYFRPYTDMLYKLNSLGFPSTIDASTFWRASYILPYQQPARGIATNPNKIVAEKPYDNDINKKTIWFVFWYQLLTANGFSGSAALPYYQYHAVPDISYFLDSSVTLTTITPNTQRKWNNQLRSLTWCMNFNLYRCGDGIVSSHITGQWLASFTGEICDDGELNGTQWYCNDTCSGTWGFFCGDEIINDGSSTTVVLSGNGLYYGPTYYSWTELIFETCDDGNDPNDPDGMFNQDGTGQFCSSICFDNFTEAFVEVFINE